jgi:hypothetical protein
MKCDRPADNPLYGALAVLSLVLAVPIAFLSLGGPYNNNQEAIMLLAVTTYSGLHLAYLIYKGTPRPMDSIFWIFSYMSFGIAPICELKTGLTTTLPIPDTSVGHRLATIAAVLLGFVAYDLFRLLHRQRPILLDRAQSEVEAARIVPLALLGIVGSLLYIHVVGLGPLFQGRAQSATALQNAGLLGSQSAGLSPGSLAGLALYQSIAQVPSLVAWLALTWIIGRQKKYRTTGWCLLWLVMLGLNIAVNNPISNPRFWFATVLFGFIFGLRLRPRGFRLLIPITLIFAMLIFPYSDYFRNQQHEQIGGRTLAQTLASKDYDQLDMLGNTLTVTHESGYRDGQQALTSALFFVPRSVWPSKSQDTGSYIGEQVDSVSQLNLSEPLWAEGYADFGIFGVVSLLGLWGLLTQTMDAMYARRRSQNAIRAVDLMVPLLAGYELIILRGSLLQAMGHCVALVLAIFFLTVRRCAAPEPMPTKSRKHVDLPSPSVGTAGLQA